jgi:hypothetical protein
MLILVDLVTEQEEYKENLGEERHSDTRGKESYTQAGECFTKKISSTMSSVVRTPRSSL